MHSEIVEIKILGILESGTDTSGISTDPGEYFSFNNFTEEYDRIFEKCKVGDECLVVGMVDDYRIISVSSVELYMAKDSNNSNNDYSYDASSDIFSGFRGIKWNSVVNFEDPNILITSRYSIGDTEYVSFKKLDENLTLANVRIFSIYYNCENGKLVKVEINWSDTKDFHVSVEIFEELMKQVGEVELLKSSRNITFVKNGIGFYFGGVLDNYGHNSLVIKANVKNQIKGTF